MKCQCDEPGHCPVFNRRMVGKLYAICRGTSDLTEARRMDYIRSWSGENAPRGAADDGPYPCKHRGTQAASVPYGGIGSMVARFFKMTGIAAAVKALAQDCRCTTREEWLNRFYPKGVVQVFECEVHGECVWHQSVADELKTRKARGCDECGDRVV